MMLFPIDAAVDLLKAYRGFIEDAPDEICGGSAILCAPPEEFVPEAIRGKPVLAVIACYVGPVDAGERAFAPLREWDAALEMLGPDAVHRRPEPDRAGQPARPPPLLEGGAARGARGRGDRDLRGRRVDVVSPFTASLMLPLGGAFARAPEGDTPLAYRRAKWNYHVLGQWADPAEAERNIQWTRDLDGAMAKYAEAGVYVNFESDPSADAIEAGFGADNYARLVEIKRRYDPDNVFHNNANIAPAG